MAKLASNYLFDCILITLNLLTMRSANLKIFLTLDNLEDYSRMAGPKFCDGMRIIFFLNEYNTEAVF